MRKFALIAACFALLGATRAAAQEEPLPNAPVRPADDFDLDAIANLVNHKPAVESVVAAPPSREAIEDRIRALSREHFRGCWRMPERENAEPTTVTVEFELSPDGSVAGPIRVTRPMRVGLFDSDMRDAVRATLTAIEQCGAFPFAADPVTAPHYELWRQVSFTFRSER